MVVDRNHAIITDNSDLPVVVISQLAAFNESPRSQVIHAD